MRIRMLAVYLLVAACQREPAGNDAQGPADSPAANEAAGPPPPDADINASLADLNMPAPPPRFVGRWATEADLCDSAAWEFSEAGLETPAGSVCRFVDMAEVPGGYDIDALCTAEAPEREDRIELRFPESAGGMTFESGSIADSGLVRCGG
jgi:hypothetical protein